MAIEIKATLPGLAKLPKDIDLLMEDDFVVDLSDWNTTKSAFLVRTRCMIDHLIRYGIKPKILQPRNVDAYNYAGRMGLFEGTDYIYPYQAQKPNSFFPLMKIENDRTNFIYEECVRVLSVYKVPENYIHSIGDIFVELANNIFYHAGTKENSGHGYVHAQAYPAGRFIHISICDLGVGILGSYEREGTLKGRTEQLLLKDVFEELESSLNKGPGSGRRGLGLNIVKGFLELHNCTLLMFTGSSQVTINKNGIYAVPSGFVMAGTLIQMRIPIYGNN